MSVSASPGIWVNSMQTFHTIIFAALLLMGALQALSAEDQTAAPADEIDPIIAEAQAAAEAAANRDPSEATETRVSGSSVDGSILDGDTVAGGSAVIDNPAASEDTFTPTIQISEDLSVSFPVDI
jgi:hypothetical protein